MKVRGLVVYGPHHTPGRLTYNDKGVMTVRTGACTGALRWEVISRRIRYHDQCHVTLSPALVSAAPASPAEKAHIPIPIISLPFKTHFHVYILQTNDAWSSVDSHGWKNRAF